MLKRTYTLMIFVIALTSFFSVLSAEDKVATSAENKPAETGNQVKDWAEFFDETLNDLTEEKHIAKEDNKKGVLLMFEMDECPFCKRMKNTILNQSAVQDYYRKNFRIISIDIEGDLELTDFDGKTTTQKDFSLNQYRVRATPVFQFIDLNGKAVKNGRLTGAAKDADEFLLLGKYIVEEQNEKMPFFKYKRAEQKGIK